MASVKHAAEFATVAIAAAAAMDGQCQPQHHTGFNYRAK